MTDGLARVLSKTDYNAEKFVNNQAVGGEEALVERRKDIHLLAEDTALALKKNVYKNYSQFIETAKEISVLESEMYQLSHMLTDQKSVMVAMLESSLTGTNNLESIENNGMSLAEKEEDLQRNLAFLLEKVEGCSSSVTEVPGRYLVEDGDLYEINPETFTKIQHVHCFLLNDSLMLTTHLPHRRGPARYKFTSLYEITNLAIVNVRDVGTCKNAFKILMFPDSRSFQAESPKAKRHWLDIIEQTKRKKSAIDDQRKEAALQALQEKQTGNPFEVSNPFEEDSEEIDNSKVSMESEFLSSDWLSELPEDLDVCIAQRDFEGAVDLVEKAEKYLHSHENLSKDVAFREYRARVDHRVKLLTHVLMEELKISPERSIRGGPRAARRAVTQLIRLGKSTQACSLFLRSRSAISQYNFRQLKSEGATMVYIRHICETFFSHLYNTGSEFYRAFPQHFACYSAFVVWSEQELRNFLEIFKQQVFVSKTTLSSVSECVYEAIKHCDRLEEIGLELSYLLHNMLLPNIERILTDSIELQKEAVRSRSQDDLWRPVNYKNKKSVEKFEEDMNALGFSSISNFTFDECFTMLTLNTIQFTRSYISFCDSALRVYSQELHPQITSALIDILTAQLKHADTSVKLKKHKNEQKFIMENATFLVECLLPLIEDKYSRQTSHTLSSTKHFYQIYHHIKTSSVTLGEFV